MVKKALMLILMIHLVIPSYIRNIVHAQEPPSFKESINEAVKNYPKISIYYEDFSAGTTFAYQSRQVKPAASTIKLPLVLYVYDLISQKKLDRNERLTYQTHHYYGGSGVIQHDPVGTKYSIKDLLYKCVTYSDNIAFIILRERVGRSNFQNYARGLGAKMVYPSGVNATTAEDLGRYLKAVWTFSKKYPQYGNELLHLLSHTVYTKTVAGCLKPDVVAHKVGYIPEKLIYNDAAIVLDQKPYILAIMTEGIPLLKQEQVISQIAEIVHHEHQKRTVALFADQLLQAEKNIPLLKSAITIVDGKVNEPSYVLFNKAKANLAEVKKAYNTLSPSTKQKYQKRVTELELWQNRAVLYCDAISAGKKIENKSASTRKFLNEGNLEMAITSFYSLTEITKRQTAFLYKPYGKSTRAAILTKYKKPAEQVLKDGYYPVLIFEELKALKVNKQTGVDITMQRSHIEQWLPLVSQKAMRSRLMQDYAKAVQ